ncbi:hypothetical protein L1987_55280 [Smallanthus sonchifolius]|uniref:Uncharacterized protein n=1 Tax=Smallanthus sonchifolius TaxID=185202 RepID=A0ACB9E992_9ASTR|nr:hypothetical protein L1987_55280 [Smallanthus sonchifolius]
MYKESEENRTIADLLQQDPDQHTGTFFTCAASISEIVERHGWYYKACTGCRKKLVPRGPTLTCLSHGDIAEPRHLYCVIATIADETGSALADGAMTLILQTKCVNMVVQNGYTDPYAIPECLHSVTGQMKVFQLELARLKMNYIL